MAEQQETILGVPQTVPLSPGTEDGLGQHSFNVNGSSEELWGLESGEPLPPPFPGSLTTSASPCPHPVTLSPGSLSLALPSPAQGLLGVAASPHLSPSPPSVLFLALSFGPGQEHLIAHHSLRAADLFCFFCGTQKIAGLNEYMSRQLLGQGVVSWASDGGEAEHSQVMARGQQMGLLFPPLESLFFSPGCRGHPEEGLAMVTVHRSVIGGK